MSSRAHFFQYGVGGTDGVVVSVTNRSKSASFVGALFSRTDHLMARSCQDGHQFYTLKTLMKMNGHSWIDILKVDVEGAEFKCVSSSYRWRECVYS